MSKRAALISAVVAVALVAAVFGATAALRLIGGGAFGPGGRPLSETDVRRLFDATPSPSPVSASPGSTKAHPSGTPSPKSGAFSSAGGDVYASCASGQATLSRWIPAGGYGTDGYLQGPAGSAWVKFKSGTSEVTVIVTCVSGNPRFVASSDDRGGGPGGDRHGGSGSGRGGHGGGS